MKIHEDIRDAQAQEFIDGIGATPILHIRSGAAPTNLSDADSGTLLSSMVLPASPFSGPTSGQITKNGTWKDNTADADGTPAHFRIKESTGTTVMAQGSVGTTGSGADMIITVSGGTITAGQPVEVTTFTINMGWA